MPPRAPPLEAPYPLYTTTYTLHRLSPLHTPPFTPPNLAQHSRTLRDLLSGDTMRGVRIGLDTPEDALSKTGALKTVSFTLLGSPSEFANAQNDDSELNESERGSLGRELYLEANGRGISISIVYERASYTALLLRHSSASSSLPGSPELGAHTSDPAGFQSYPLLATRMPGSLRSTLLSYLADTFDTHASPLQLSTPFLTRTLDVFLDRTFHGLGDENATRVTKDILITLSFAPLPTTDGARADEDADLKSVDISIARDDVAHFFTRGRKALQAAQRSGEVARGGAFWMALTHYAKSHMAMDIGNADVRVSKVACGAFVLGREGRMKVFAPGALGGGEDANAIEAAEEIWAESVEEVVERVVAAAETSVLSS